MKKNTKNFLIGCVICSICVCLLCIAGSQAKIKQLQRNISEMEKELGHEEIPLLPCPFCGGNAIIQPVQDSFYIECDGCEMRTDYLKSKADLIDYWNMRNQCENGYIETVGE